MAGLAAVGLISFLQAADLELENERGWNQAREAYFRIASDPIQPYRMDGVKGKIVDLRFYSTPNPEILLVTFGETYENTTGWDLHVALVPRDGKPVYPGNVHLSPNGADIAVDWIDETTMGVFYRSGYYPDRRDVETGQTARNADFVYERKIGTTSVRFIGVDSREFDERRWSMDSRRIVTPANESAAPPVDLAEPWIINIDLTDWVASTRPAGPEVVERVYVPEGQTAEIWKEMLTSALSLGDLTQQIASVEMLREYFSENCPSFEFEILERSKKTVLVQWSHDGCLGEPPLYKIVQLVEMPEGVLYAAKTRDVPATERQAWREAIRRAEVRALR